MLVVAAVLLAWHGILISMPHDHADASVPQEELACSVSRPSSQTNHLHSSGRLMAPRPCFACLAGSTTADGLGVETAAKSSGGGLPVAVASSDLRSRFHTHLPLLRGPPART
jgi:hypothetical protein